MGVRVVAFCAGADGGANATRTPAKVGMEFPRAKELSRCSARATLTLGSIR